MTTLHHACAIALLSTIIGCSGVVVGTGTADAGASESPSPGSSASSASSDGAGSSGSGATAASGGASGSGAPSGACNDVDQVGPRLSIFTTPESPAAPAGGAITDGTWATSHLDAYDPSMPAGSPYNDWEGETYRLRGNNTYDWVLGDPDRPHSRESGTFTTNGTTITFTPSCSSLDARRVPSPPAPRMTQYTATATTLTLFGPRGLAEVVQTLAKQ